VLKTRLIPTLQLRSWGLVKSKRFSEWRPIGPAVVAGRVYDSRGVDELIALDIDAPREGRGPSFPLIGDLADNCFMPFTAGGGVRSRDDVDALLRSGADKISINSALVDNPALVEECAREFGSQCVVASIDARRVDGGYEAFTGGGERATGISPVELARQAAGLGAGEVLLQSIDRDGTMDGYDIELTAAVAEAVEIPVIACGGAGEPSHMVEAIVQGGAHAVSAASIFHFTRYTPDDVKRTMREAGLEVRLRST
jgi:cyclase